MQLSVIQKKIFEIRGQKVMLDFDLASLYEVETRVLKQAVKRNIERFPEDFMFRLTSKESDDLVSQSVIPSKKYLGGALPYAFTEQGVAMLSSILNSQKAIDVNINIIRTFVIIRQQALQFKELHEKLQKLEKQYNKKFKEIYIALNLLLDNKRQLDDFASRERIGFKK